MGAKPETATGGCLCGAVRYRANGKPIWVPHCHCSMCKRTSGSAFLTLAGFPHNQIEWLGEEPTVYRSSEIGTRNFCSRCGSSIYATFSFPPDEVWLTVGTLDDPSTVKPEAHVYCDDMVPWLKIDDDLPRHPSSLRFPR